MSVLSHVLSGLSGSAVVPSPSAMFTTSACLHAIVGVVPNAETHVCVVLSCHVNVSDQLNVLALLLSSTHMYMYDALSRSSHGPSVLPQPADLQFTVTLTRHEHGTSSSVTCPDVT